MCVNVYTVNLQLSALLAEAVDANTAGDRGRTGLYLSALREQVEAQRVLLTEQP